MKKKIVIGVAGSSGSIYTRVLFERLTALKDQWSKVGVVMSRNALINWELEVGPFDAGSFPFDFYEVKNKQKNIVTSIAVRCRYCRARGLYRCY